MAKCRLCNIPIDKEKDDWIMPSKNYYYHKQCYNNWKKVQPKADEEYVDFFVVVFGFLS